MAKTHPSFGQRAVEILGFYVYALFDPRSSNLPFYVGKGCGNRVFDHARGAIAEDAESSLSLKLNQICDIQASGLSVDHKILRFGLSEDEAFRIEATLIDFVNFVQPDCLTNLLSGQGVAEGFYDARDLAVSLAADPLDCGETKLLLVKIDRKWSELLQKYGAASDVPDAEIFEATRGDWRINAERVSGVEYVLGIARGLVRGVFAPATWVDAGHEGRKRIDSLRSVDVPKQWLGKSVTHLSTRGSQNPLRYLPSDDS